MYPVEPWVVVAGIVLGLVGVVLALTLLARLLGLFFRGLGWVLGIRRTSPQMTSLAQGSAFCPRRRCRHPNPPHAHFCARCGAEL